MKRIDNDSEMASPVTVDTSGYGAGGRRKTNSIIGLDTASVYSNPESVTEPSNIATSPSSDSMLYGLTPVQEKRYG